MSFLLIGTLPGTRAGGQDDMSPTQTPSNDNGGDDDDDDHDVKNIINHHDFLFGQIMGK